MRTQERSERPSDQAHEQQSQANEPVPDEPARARAKQMMKAYDERPTAVLPGSDNTVTGTAVNDWLDEEGQPIYGTDNNAGNSA